MHRKIRAFTLIELMVVIVIIGILASLAIPRLTAMVSKAKLAEFKPQLKSLFILQETYLGEKGHYAPASNYAEDNRALGFPHPVAGNFAYSVLSPTVTSAMLKKELALVRMVSGKTLRLSDRSVLSAAEGVVACVDGEGIQYATSSQIRQDAGLNSEVDPCE